MKKVLLSLCLTILSSTFAWSQCVPTCSNYAVSPVTFSVFPTGTTVSPSSFYPNADDGTLTAVPIGFSFDYFCNTYNNVIICTNGFIQLDYGTPPDFSSPVVHPPQTFPSSTPPNNIVSLNMVDFDPGVGGVISYTTVGSSPNRMFVVTYSNVPIFGASQYLNTGQIILYESSNYIAIHTGTLYGGQSFLGYGTQGIENSTGTAGKTPPGRNNNPNWYSSANNTAFLFTPYTPTPPTSITGPTLLCQGSTDIYNATFMIGASSYTWTLPTSWSGSSGTNSITANTGASGTISVTATYTCGMSAPTTLSVTISPAPTVAISSIAPNVVCSGNSVSINITGNAQSFTIEPGGLNGPTPIVDTPTASIVYTLTGEDALGCISVNTATAAVLVKETPTVTVNSGTICQGQTFTMMPTGANNYTYSSTFPQVNPVAGTYTYSVIGTGTNGCVSNTAISSLTVSSIPAVTVSANRTTMCRNESVILTSGGADTYSWSPVSMGGNSVVVSPTVATGFTVTGYNTMGCAKTASVFILVNPCVGINEITGENVITLYPNPSSGEVIIQSPEAASVSVYDITGKLVLTQELVAGENKINLSQQPTGKYLVKAILPDRQKTLILIKN
jgi:hypothetical protein